MNGQAGHHLRNAIAISLEIHQSQVYKEIIDIDLKGIVSTKNGKTYKIRLVEIK